VTADVDRSVLAFSLPLEAFHHQEVHDFFDWRVILELVDVSAQLDEKIENSYVEIAIFARVTVTRVRAEWADPSFRFRLFQWKVIAVLNTVKTVFLIAAQEQAIFDVEEGLVNVLGVLIFARYELLRALIEELRGADKLAVMADVLLIRRSGFQPFRDFFGRGELVSIIVDQVVTRCRSFSENAMVFILVSLR